MSELIAVGFIIASAAYILNAMGFAGTRAFLAFGSAVMLVFILGRVGEVIAPLLPIMDSPVGELADSAVRIVGIGYIGGFFSDVCLELGARGASDAISLLIRIEIAAVVVPYLMDILSMARELLL